MKGITSFLIGFCGGGYGFILGGHFGILLGVLFALSIISIEHLLEELDDRT